MNFYIRADASIKIGTGHILRCLALAEDFKENNDEVVFICRELEGNLIGFLIEKGYKVIKLQNVDRKDRWNTNFITNSYSDWLGVEWTTDAIQTIEVISTNKLKIDWLIIDHYSIDYNWEKAIRPYTKKIMVIDDIANRKHDSDVLLDQNCISAKTYEELVPKRCMMLLGYKYALIRSEFRNSNESHRERDGSIKRILIYFGGSDITQQIPKVLKALEKLDLTNIIVEILIGINNRDINSIEKLCKKNLNYKLHKYKKNIVETIENSDIAICACGYFTLERYFLGLPGVTIEVAENQHNIAKMGSLLGVDCHLGKSTEVTTTKIYNTIKRMLASPEKVKVASDLSKKLVDGNGAVRVASLLRRME